MLIIRLMRVGKKNSPSFRLIITEKTSAPQSGRFLELLGNYNPRKIIKGKKAISLNPERIKYWLSQGVQVSDTAYNLLVSQKIVEAVKRKKKISLKKKKGAEKEASKPAEAPAKEAKTEEAKVEEVKKEEVKAGETKQLAPAEKN